MPQESVLEQRLREIREQFQKNLQSRAERVANLWSTLLNGWNEEIAKSLYADVHRLHGSCGTLGFTTVSELSSEIQKLIQNAINEQSLPSSEIQIEITSLIDRLNSNCR